MLIIRVYSFHSVRRSSFKLPFVRKRPGSQPFKTEKDYSDWLKRMDKFPEWMDAAADNFRDGINNKVVLPKN